MSIKRPKAQGSTAGKRGAPSLRANVAELRAVAHPLRLRILELFAESPRTTKQVADLLGQPPTRLYHHVNALERVGLLQLKETRPNRGVVEKWFTAGPRYAAVPSSDPKDRSVSGLAMTVLDQSRHEVAAALRTREPDGARPLVVRAIVVGPARHQERVRTRVTQLLVELQREGRKAAQRAARANKAKPAKGDGETNLRWALTISLAPVALVATTGRGGRKAPSRSTRR